MNITMIRITLFISGMGFSIKEFNGGGERMALILARYEGYFNKGPSNYEKFEAGYRAYFDTCSREFSWLKPKDACMASHKLVLLPIISQYETYCTFLKVHALESVIQTYASLNERDFCIAVRKEGDAAGFLQALGDYADRKWIQIVQRWITENGIENCKPTWKRYSGALCTKEDIQSYLQFTKDQIEYEKAQEEAFKKSRLKQPSCEAAETEQSLGRDIAT